MQSVQAADSTWLLRQLQQTDGYIQNDDAAPATSTSAVGTHNQASPAAADNGQTPRPDDEAFPINQAVYDELQHNRD